jgi:hypothetical protein
LQRTPIPPEGRTVHRFVHTDRLDVEQLAQDFVADEDNPNVPGPDERERLIPELQEGMSAFGSEEAARDVWEQILRPAAARRGQDVRAGDFIAEVDLVPDRGFEIEDLQEETGHLTIWGDPVCLAEAVHRPPYPAERNAA